MRLIEMLAAGAVLGGLLLAAPLAEAGHRHHPRCGHYDRYDRHYRGHNSYRPDYHHRHSYRSYGYGWYGYGPGYGYGYGYRYGRPYPAPYVGWHYHGRQRCHRSHGGHGGHGRHW